MRALVLGGTGMLGRAVAHEWRRRDEAVLALSHHQADIMDRDRLVYWAERFRPRFVINCAAFTRVDDCESQPELALAVNGHAVAHAVAAAEHAGAYLFHISSDYVFDGRATSPYSEDAATAPFSVYGASKLLGEQKALRYPRTVVLRTSWLFGPGGGNFVVTIRRLLREGRTPLRIVDDQTGCPTYTPFVARAIADLAAHATDNPEAAPLGVMHYSNREAVSWYGFAAEIARHLEPAAKVLPVPTSEFPRPATRPGYSVLDVTRFESTVRRRVEAWTWGLAAYLDYLGDLS